MSIKNGGLEVFWNGIDFRLSHNNRIISVPEFLTKGLPENVKLQGELW